MALTYTGSILDRRAWLRLDADQLHTLLRASGARILPVWNQKQAFDETPRPHFIDAATLDRFAAEPVFLGFGPDDAPWFAAGLTGEAAPDIGAGAQFRTLNEVVTLLTPEHASILAYARAMVIWHDNHRHCGRCGAPALAAEGGHARACSNPACGHRSYPRTDPAVITLVEDAAGTRCLMGRQSRWPAGMYSIIAGFVEPGESLEETVVRETFEETGIRVGEVRYIASQPWPFPSSIMLGFRARALSMEINRTDDELEDCRWFTRADLADFGRPGSPYADLRLPNPFSISRYLVNMWIAEGPR